MFCQGLCDVRKHRLWGNGSRKYRLFLLCPLSINNIFIVLQTYMQIIGSYYFFKVNYVNRQ